MYSIEEFIQELANERTEKVGVSENVYAGNTRESIIRKHNLLTYLTKMKSVNPRILLLGEAPGHKGCRLTGIPFTSERVLANHSFFQGLDFHFINENLECEQSATIVWNVLQNFTDKPLIWDIFLFHSYDGINFNTNSTPNETELELGKEYVIKLLQIFIIDTIFVCSRTLDSKLK